MQTVPDNFRSIVCTKVQKNKLQQKVKLSLGLDKVRQCTPQSKTTATPKTLSACIVLHHI